MTFISKSDSLEIRLFKVVLIVTTIGTCILLVHDTIFAFSIRDFLIETAAILGSFVFLILSRKEQWINTLIHSYMFFMIILLDLAWLVNKGLRIGLSLDYLVILIIGVVIINKKWRTSYLILFYINLLSILLLEFVYPEHFYYTIDNRLETVLSKIVFILITYSLAVMVVVILKEQYDASYILNKRQNDILENQNKEIQLQNGVIQTQNANLEKLVEERTQHINNQKERLLQYAFFNSHKVRAPLSNILGLIELLKDDVKNDAETSSLLQSLHNESNRLDAEIRYVQEIIHETPTESNYQELALKNYSTQSKKTNMKIVAIDDDLTFLNIIQIMIKRYTNIADLEVVLYSDSKIALQEIEQQAPDIILLDLFMPEINGWEFMSQLNQKTIRPKVYILSSSVDYNDKSKAKEYDLVRDFISKPLSSAQLVKVVSLN